MSKPKTEKELAILYDLYVASDWGERFAELLEAHTALPEKGRVLYVAAGTGGQAIEWQEKVGTDVSVVGTEENAEMLALAQGKAEIVKSVVTVFQAHAPDNLALPDGHFALTVCEASLLERQRIPTVLKELARVTQAGGTVALTLVTSGSFGEFVSLYWEALFRADIAGHEHDAEDLLLSQPTVEDVTQWARAARLAEVEAHTRKEEFSYESGAAFVEAPLVAEFLLKDWLAAVPDDATRQRLTEAVAELADQDRNGLPFNFSVKATLVRGRKR